jgi:hypothetical protein
MVVSSAPFGYWTFNHRRNETIKMVPLSRVNSNSQEWPCSGWAILRGVIVMVGSQTFEPRRGTDRIGPPDYRLGLMERSLTRHEELKGI